MFRTKRMIIQFISILLIQSCSSERPCSLVESGCRPGSNMALWYSHIRVMLLPNLQDPFAPLPLILLTLHFIKGHMSDQSVIRTFPLYCESPANSFTCPVRYLLTLCFMDNAFIHFPNIRSMFHLSQPVTSLIEAMFKPELKEIPIFRREFASAESRGTIDTSPDLAELYDSYRLQL